MAFLLQNVYPLDAARASAVAGRPGFTQAGSQLGSSGKRTGQLLYQFTKLSGTEITVAIVGGQFYTYDWGSDTWTESVTAANFSTASITLSQTAHCYAVTFANTMVITDGVNTPFTWDGTAGAGGLVKLTNCPALYGKPTVYYAKLFGIKNTARSTIVWSEENDPTSGYDSGSFTNSWQLGQTDQEPLYAVVGTNGALYYFRGRSTGVISGAVNADFVTAGVHDAVSGTVGTQSPGSPVYYEGRIYFVDANWKPRVIVPGSGVDDEMWGDVQETVIGLDRQYVSTAVGVYDASTQQVLQGVVELGQTFPSLQIAIDPTQGAGQVSGLWRGFTFHEMALVKNASGEPVLMHLSSDGYAYAHGQPDGSSWDDELNAGTQAIQHIVEPSPMGGDVSIEKRFDRMDIELRTQSDMTGLSVGYETTRGRSVAQSVPSLSGDLSRFDVAVWDTDVWSVSSTNQHVAIGLNSQGRWIKPIVQHETLGEQFGLGQVRVVAQPLNNAPGNP